MSEEFSSVWPGLDFIIVTTALLLLGLHSVWVQKGKLLPAFFSTTTVTVIFALHNTGLCSLLVLLLLLLLLLLIFIIFIIQLFFVVVWVTS